MVGFRDRIKQKKRGSVVDVAGGEELLGRGVLGNDAPVIQSPSSWFAGVTDNAKPDGSNGADGSNGDANADATKVVDPYGADAKQAYFDIVSKFETPYKEETPEEKAARERRDAIRVGWSGFLDGLNAISNLYYTTKGAPSQKLGSSVAPVMADIKEKEAVRRAQEQANAKARFDHGRMVANAMADWELGKMKYQAAEQARKAEAEDRQAMAIINAKIAQGKMLTEHELAMLEEDAKQKNRMTLAGANNASRMKIAEYNQTQANKRAEMNAKSKASNKDSLTLTVNGERKSFDYDKSKNGALINVYNLIRKAATERIAKGESVDEIEDMNMQFGEGGDISSKALTIIKRRLPDFPELNDVVMRLMGLNEGEDDVIDYDSDDEDIIDY